MKVLLVGINAKYSHTALAIEYIDKACEGIDTRKIEFNINQDISYMLGEILKSNSDIICFSTYIWNIELVQKLTEDLFQIGGRTVAWAGLEASYDVEDHFLENPGLDIIIRGEGELTNRELFEKLESKESLEDILGISYREDDRIIHNPDRPLIENLDEVPSPFKNIKAGQGKMIYYEMSRGCPFKCTYCLSSTMEGLRYFSKDRIKEDLLEIIESDAKVVKLVDRTFNANEKFSMEIMTFIRENAREDMVFHMELMAHMISDDFLEFLSGLPKDLFQFEIGIQSSNEKTLKAIDRVTDLDRLAYVVRKIKSFSNIHLHVDLIVGLPYEDYQSFRDSFDYAYSLGADKIQIGFLKVLRGSKISQETDKYEIKYRSYPPYEVLQTKYISSSQIYRLKIIEDIVDRYYNEGYFDHTLKYLIKDESPFKFFEEFSIYWEDMAYHARSHSRQSLYLYLYEYLKDREDIDLLVEYLRYDFLLNQKSRPARTLRPRPIEKHIYHDLLRNEKIREIFDLDMDLTTKKLVPDFTFEIFDFGSRPRIYGIYHPGRLAIDISQEYERIANVK